LLGLSVERSQLR